MGATAIYGQRKMSHGDFEHIAGFANQAAIAIKNAQLFGEVEKLKNQLQAECAYLQEEIKSGYNYGDIIGRSAAIKNVLSKVEQIAVTNTTVLILGETATGKELVKVSCATLPANLIETIKALTLFNLPIQLGV